MNKIPRTNLSDIYSEREHTVQTKTTRSKNSFIQSLTVSPFATGLVVIIFVFVGFLVIGYIGYTVGIDNTRSISATAEMRELDLQVALANKDVDNGNYMLALERLEYVLNVSPNYPGAQKLFVDARSHVDVDLYDKDIDEPAEVFSYIDVSNSGELIENIRLNYKMKLWQDVIIDIEHLKLTGEDFDQDEINSILFVALRNRGIQSIESGDIELGLTDLEHAEQIVALDSVAEQRRRWASLYLYGATFWDINWKIVVDNLYILYQIAPNFRDTEIKLWQAYMEHGSEFLGVEEYCDAKDQFVFADNLRKDASLTNKLKQAIEGCDLELGNSTNGTQTE
tara:strand:+ start:3378 stop:4391 length:1014 start_codon:yes stop_codon:yes gene_type:complete